MSRFLVTSARAPAAPNAAVEEAQPADSICDAQSEEECDGGSDSDSEECDGDVNSGSEQRLKEAAQRLRDVYSGQLASACPQRDVLFHCALGLSLTCMPGDTELAVRILEQLLSSGYMRSQCALQLAKCLHREGRIVRARQLLSDCLAEDPRNADALDFQYDFDLAVKRDGKIALYGAIGLLAAIAIAWTAYKQGSGNNIGSSGLTAVQQIKAPSGTAVGSALIAR